MPRPARSAKEIQAEIDKLLNVGRKFPIKVPLPVRLALPSDPFADHEANWAVPTHPSFASDRAAVKAAIVAVKVKWDLTE